MSNQPEQIPPPAPTPQDQAPNPYAGRDHEDGSIKTKSDVLAVAGLLGSVSGELGRIDQQNVGGDSQFIKAKKLDPRETLNNIVGGAPIRNNQPVAPPPVPQVQQNASQPPPQQRAPQVSVRADSEIEKRVKELEKVVETYKKITKFKRGVSYTVNTTSIKGEFKSPEDILDIISSEMAKGTKSITLKLNDTTKNR